MLTRLSVNICGRPSEIDGGLLSHSWASHFSVLYSSYIPNFNASFQWPKRSSGAYSNISGQLSGLQAKFDDIDFLYNLSQPLMALCKESITALQPLFRFLFDLEQTSALEKSTPDFLQQLLADFRLGPHGLGPVIKYIADLHNLVILTYEQQNMHADEARQCIAQINIIAVPLESLLVTFRSSVFRGLYDPEGFSHLQDALKERSYIFGVRRDCLVFSTYR